jgi:hypothetical protein
MPRSREPWTLDQQAFDGLLRRLGGDRENAGLHFEELRHKLVQFFSYRRCRFPDRWADESLDRLAKRISEGAEIEDINAFVRRIASLVLLEAQKVETREYAIVPDPRAVSGSERHRDSDCLEYCLKQLPLRDRSLIERYYDDVELRTPEMRLQLARSYGLTIDALRTRAVRIRRELLGFLRRCRDQASGGEAVADRL